MGKVCVCGASELQIDYANKTVTANGHTLKEGDYISIDGTAGEVFAGEVTTAPSEIVQVLVSKTLQPEQSKRYAEYAALMTWADKCRKLDIRTNADTPEQVENAIAFGAEGIGLCRTEHMFFEGDRIDAMREMILAGETEDREKALAKLLPYQREDFVGIFRALNGLPATIRLLDPPLHEFLPHDHAAAERARRKTRDFAGRNLQAGARAARVQPDAGPSRLPPGHRLSGDLRDAGPRRFRGGRQGADRRHQGAAGDHDSARRVSRRNSSCRSKSCTASPRKSAKEKKVKFKYLVGTMIEIPRAALVADEIAEDAEFFSFGTNDLTQTTLGMSRDDSGSFLPRLPRARNHRDKSVRLD